MGVVLTLTLVGVMVSPVCDSYVRPETLVRICDECNFGTYGGRCIICGSPGEGFYFIFPFISPSPSCAHTFTRLSVDFRHY